MKSKINSIFCLCILEAGNYNKGMKAKWNKRKNYIVSRIVKLLTVSKRFQLKKLNFLVNQTKYGDNRKPKENIQNPC